MNISKLIRFSNWYNASSGIRTIVVFVCILSIIALAGCGGSGSSSQSQTTSGAPASLPVWTNSFSIGGFSFPFTMVGTDPSIAGAGTTSIPLQIVPVTFTFAGNVFSSTSVACGDTVNAVVRFQNSPLLTNFPWLQGGTTQYTDAFQRTNLWKFVGSISPNYHVLFQPVTTLAPVNVDVPLTTGAFVTGNPGCPQHPLLTIPAAFMDTLTQQVVTTQHITPNILPVFLTFNTLFVPPGGNPLSPIVGYHKTIGGGQTVVVGSYMDQGPGNSIDVAVLSHELGEWMDNPNVSNRVPPWGNVGQVTTCSSLLEVGDPLSDHIVAVSSGGFTYHIQELAYLSWFARSVPSIAINGLYSNGGTFVSPAPILPNGPDCP